MSNLSKFDVLNETKSYRQDIFTSLKNILTIGLEEFAKSLTNIISSGSPTKNQVNKQLSRWEKSLYHIRSIQ